MERYIFAGRWNLEVGVIEDLSMDLFDYIGTGRLISSQDSTGYVNGP